MTGVMFSQIHYAAECGNVRAVGNLLALGVSVNSRDEVRRRARASASDVRCCAWARSTGPAMCPALALTHCFLGVCSLQNSWCPLHHAAKSGQVGTLRLLLDKGADVDARLAVRESPLIALLLARLLLTGAGTGGCETVPAGGHHHHSASTILYSGPTHHLLGHAFNLAQRCNAVDLTAGPFSASLSMDRPRSTTRL